MRALLIAATLFAAAPAVAQTPAPAPATHAVLADAARAPAGRLIIDGATWRCEGATCTASGGASQPATRACRRVVARLGAVSAFSYKGVALSAEQIAACNA
ncbi:MAG: CC_3452 family protein [Brevundimonas sp.]